MDLLETVILQITFNGNNHPEDLMRPFSFFKYIKVCSKIQSFLLNRLYRSRSTNMFKKLNLVVDLLGSCTKKHKALLIFYSYPIFLNHTRAKKLIKWAKLYISNSRPRSRSRSRT